MHEAVPEAFSAYSVIPVDLGRSGAQVFRLTAPGKLTLFLKRAEGSYRSHLRHEAARLTWLSGKLPVPEVMQYAENDAGAWLVTTALPGLDLTAFNEEAPEVKRRLTEELAHALQRFHRTDTGSCPFDHSAEQELGRLEKELAARESALGHDLPGVRKKLEQLRHLCPEETLVLTHGDACLPNIMVMDSKLSGFIDLGAAGRADRCRDLERACWSLVYNYGNGYDELFLEAYGANHHDRAKLNFYRTLEWFSLEDAPQNIETPNERPESAS